MSRATLAFVALLLVVVVGQWVLENRAVTAVRDAQREGCNRGNVLRRETNSRVKAHETETQVLAAFIASAQRGHLSVKAFEYEKQLDRLHREKFHRVPLAVC